MAMQISEMFHVSQLLLLDRSDRSAHSEATCNRSVLIKRAWSSAWAGDRHDDVRVGVTTLTSRSWGELLSCD